MIDLHCHILPEIDDGAQNMQEALDMCRMAVADGITTIVATPHYQPGACSWSAKELNERVASLQDELRKTDTPLTIVPGAELLIFPELQVLLKGDPFLTINRSIYFLVEFRPHTFPPNAAPFLISLMKSGLAPVIAHPERYDWFARQPDFFDELLGLGALFQLSAGSILGEFGPTVQEFSMGLIRRGMIQVIASDGHNRSDRPPLLSQAVTLVANLVGTARAEAMVTTTPAAIIANQRLQIPITEDRLLPRTTPPPSWFRRLLGAAA